MRCEGRCDDCPLFEICEGLVSEHKIDGDDGMSELFEKISKLADIVGVDPQFGNLAIIESAISIVENMEKIIEEKDSLICALQSTQSNIRTEIPDWTDISVSQPENNSIKLFKDKNGKRIVGKFRRSDREWECKYWAVFDILNHKLLHESITHWQNVSDGEEAE